MSRLAPTPGSILVGLQSPAGAAGAVELGLRIATEAGAKLHVVAAASDPFADVVAVGLGLDAERMHEDLLTRRWAALTRELEPVLPAEMIQTGVQVELGRTEHVLVHEARRHDADLIVLPGWTPSKRDRPAEVARHLLRTLHRPALLSGPTAGAIGRVVAAVDLSFATRPTIEFAAEMARLLDAPYEVVHVAAVPELPVEWSGSPDASEQLLQTESQIAAGVLEDLLPSGVGHRTLRGDISATLRGLAAAEPSMLLVVGTQGRGWVHRRILGSTTDALLNNCGAALAVVPVAPTDSG